MKYMMMLVRSDTEWEALTDDERDSAGIMRWWGELAPPSRSPATGRREATRWSSGRSSSARVEGAAGLDLAAPSADRRQPASAPRVPMVAG
jgi:hypothetical protein